MADPARWLRITKTEPYGPVIWSSSSDRLFYFCHLKDGHHCLWARRWQGAEAGTEEPVSHFHSRRRFSWNPWLALSGDRLVFTMTDTTANIWAIEPANPR
jgi:hypothetical protein